MKRYVFASTFFLVFYGCAFRGDFIQKDLDANTGNEIDREEKISIDFQKVI